MIERGKQVVQRVVTEQCQIQERIFLDVIPIDDCAHLKYSEVHRPPVGARRE